MRFVAAFLALMVFCGFTAPAQAAWYEASSDHFVIYADDREENIREFAENLERYHSALALVTGREVEKPSPSNRLVIFVVGSQGDIRRLAGENARTVAGFYIARAGGSVAFVQDVRMGSGEPTFSTVVLLHEYAHHFLISSSSFAMPRWLSEGSAEFFATTSFNRDGSVQLGRPARHRAAELAYADGVTIEQLLDAELYQNRRGRRYDAFYGRSWALFHYLTFNEGRAGQLTAYWNRIAQGEPSLDAARAAFGDLTTLDREIDRYLRQRRMLSLRIAPERVAIGEVHLRALPEGEAEMMAVRIRSQRGVNEDTAPAVLEDARRIAARHPNDPGVLAALAEAEYDAGNDSEAIAAADRALALDASRTNAYVQKGLALFRMAKDADDQETAYAQAMAPFSALNAIENDHPLPLMYYYRSFAERGVEPNQTARDALQQAAGLAPFDHSLAMSVAVMHANHGEVALATHALAPVAANPHGGRTAETARLMLTGLEDAEEGAPFDLRAIAAANDTAEEGEGEDAEATD